MDELYEINGMVLLTSESPYYMLSKALSCIPCIQFWSHDALEDMLLGLVDMIAEVSEDYRHIKRTPGVAKTKFTKFVNKGYKIFIPRDRQKLVNMIYEIMLKGHGLSTLHNFGFANRYGDSLDGNPERQSMVELDQKNEPVYAGDILLEMKKIEEEDKIC